MALNSSTHSAYITKLREWFGEDGADYNEKWSQTITVYKVGSSIPVEDRSMDKLLENYFTSSTEVLSRRMGGVDSGWVETIVFGNHTKTDEKNLFVEYFGEQLWHIVKQF